MEPLRFPPKPRRGWPNTPLHQNLINDPNWIVEPKKNGERCIITIDNGEVALWSRRGVRVTYAWLKPLITELAHTLPYTLILDGEIFARPQPRCELWLFDIPSQDGPLSQRRIKLLKLFEINQFQYIHLMPWLKDKEIAYDACIAAGHEGVVFKQLTSAYKLQRKPEDQIVEWVKFKPASAEGW